MFLLTQKIIINNTKYSVKYDSLKMQFSNFLKNSIKMLLLKFLSVKVTWCSMSMRVDIASIRIRN